MDVWTLNSNESGRWWKVWALHRKKV